MCCNKELCIKLKETKIDDQNLWLPAADLCTYFCKPFEKLLQNKDEEKLFCFCFTNILYLNQINIYLQNFWRHGYYYHKQSDR